MKDKDLREQFEKFVREYHNKNATDHKLGPYVPVGSVVDEPVYMRLGEVLAEVLRACELVVNFDFHRDPQCILRNKASIIEDVELEKFLQMVRDGEVDYGVLEETAEDLLRRMRLQKAEKIMNDVISRSREGFL